METIASTGGRVVIPSEIRRKLGIKEGTYLHIEVDEQGRKIILTPITQEYVHSLRGNKKAGG